MLFEPAAEQQSVCVRTNPPSTCIGQISLCSIMHCCCSILTLTWDFFYSHLGLTSHNSAPKNLSIPSEPRSVTFQRQRGKSLRYASVRISRWWSSLIWEEVGLTNLWCDLCGVQWNLKRKEGGKRSRGQQFMQIMLFMQMMTNKVFILKNKVGHLKHGETFWTLEPNLSGSAASGDNEDQG